MTRLIAPLLLAALSTGCAFGLPDAGTPEPGEPTSPGAGSVELVSAGPAHCDAIVNRSICVEFENRAAAEAECPGIGGTVDDGACPAQDRLAACALGDRTRRFYTTGGSPEPVEAVKQTCTDDLNGSFSPGA